MNCSECIHWVQMKEHEGICALHEYATPSDAWCEEGEEDDER